MGAGGGRGQLLTRSQGPSSHLRYKIVILTQQVPPRASLFVVGHTGHSPRGGGHPPPTGHRAARRDVPRTEPEPAAPTASSPSLSSPGALCPPPRGTQHPLTECLTSLLLGPGRPPPSLPHPRSLATPGCFLPPSRMFLTWPQLLTPHSSCTSRPEHGSPEQPSPPSVTSPAQLSRRPLTSCVSSDSPLVP